MKNSVYDNGGFIGRVADYTDSDYYTQTVTATDPHLSNVTLLIKFEGTDGGTTFTAATLSDSGYVTGSSGQRILTGQATISGQPSGQSMRWKLALANKTVKVHGVALQWS